MGRIKLSLRIKHSLPKYLKQISKEAIYQQADNILPEEEDNEDLSVEESINEDDFDENPISSHNLVNVPLEEKLLAGNPLQRDGIESEYQQ